MCLPSDALLQHLQSYLGFSYLGHGVSLHGCSSNAQLLLLTLDDGYLLTAAPPDLEHGVAPLGPPVPVQPPLLGHGVAPLCQNGPLQKSRNKQTNKSLEAVKAGKGVEKRECCYTVGGNVKLIQPLWETAW